MKVPYGSRIVSRGWTDGRDELIVAFRNFVNAPTSEKKL